MVFYQIFGIDKILIFYCLQETLQCYLNLSFHILFYEIHVCFLLQKNEGNSNNKNHRGVYALLLLIMLIVSLLQIMLSFSNWNQQKNNSFFVI